MRLTLRTLLAWLDDTLSPSEVREIGRQVGESPFAKDLVEKIHKVTRQRRLTVPSRTGADGVDPNIVASYLDNELDPDQVAELEKRCLTSDVHLAEVASVHQILSLIGQKAKVPTEARHRMYHLIKGRESVKPRAVRASLQTEPSPVSEPVQPWVTPPPPPRPWIERFGPVALVVALMLVMCLAAWNALEPPEVTPKSTLPAAPAKGAIVAAQNAPAAKPAESAPKEKTSQVETIPEKKDATEVATTQSPVKAKETQKSGSDVPAGSVGLAKKPVGALLRYNPERREWERLTDLTPLRDQDRLLSLAPFRSSVEIGTAMVDLVGEAEIWARATRGNQAGRLSLAQGRVVLHGTNPSLPFELQHAGRVITVLPPPGVAVGVERLNRRALGEPRAGAPILRFSFADGPVTIKADSQEETLDGPGGIVMEADGSFSDKNTKAPQSWVTETEPSPFDQKIGEQFLKFFRPDRPIVSSLVEASEDEQKDVCRLAISALRAVGDISYIVPLLNKRGDSNAATARKTAIVILRAFLAQGPDSAKVLREQLQGDLGEEQAATSEKLLVGYTSKEAEDPSTYDRLVKILGNTDPAEVGVRELALDNLMTLTGRDDLDYDPEKPVGDNGKGESKGLKAWRDLLRDKELRPTATKNAGK
jgi:hypothetical protein